MEKFPCLSVVIPARNEQGVIASTAIRFADGMRGGWRTEIIVVDDYSTDNTAAMAASTRDVRVIKNMGRQGYADAVRTGLVHARGDFIAIVVADGSDDPGDLFRMMVRAHRYNEAVFSHRFIPGHAPPVDYPPAKRVANRLGNIAASRLLGINHTDLTNPFKVLLRAGLLDALLDTTASGFALGFELGCRYATNNRGGYSTMDVGWRDRRVGKSKFKPRHVVDYATALARLTLETNHHAQWDGPMMSALRRVAMAYIDARSSSLYITLMRDLEKEIARHMHKNSIGTISVGAVTCSHLEKSSDLAIRMGGINIRDLKKGDNQ